MTHQTRTIDIDPPLSLFSFPFFSIGDQVEAPPANFISRVKVKERGERDLDREMESVRAKKEKEKGGLAAGRSIWFYCTRRW